MSVDSEKPNITWGIWMKYCTVAKSISWSGKANFCRSERLRARRLRSAAGLINSDRHVLDSRCADRCANDAFLTWVRATLKLYLEKNVRSVHLASKSTNLRLGTQKTFGRKNTVFHCQSLCHPAATTSGWEHPKQLKEVNAYVIISLTKNRPPQLRSSGTRHYSFNDRWLESIAIRQANTHT